MDSKLSARYYPRSALELTEVLPGASMWAVALEQTQLTYFEVEPHSRFEMHQHESEQITYVLAGTLYFDVGEEIYSVGAGEVIAVPSNTPHAVYTLSEYVNAVDAWSPVMDRYRSESA